MLMMYKKFILVVVTVTSSIGLIYFFQNNQNNLDTTYYDLLAIADHEKLALGEFNIVLSSGNSLENLILSYICD